ncbi:MAG: hypothetical protein ABFS56_29040 [Pseudomonadota bacterium]|jgi:DNA transposition AAA+ family ATPase
MSKNNLTIDKEWLREFADKNGITFKQLATEICPNTPEQTLRGLWKKRYAASGIYADALYWYAQAKRKKWEWVN